VLADQAFSPDFGGLTMLLIGLVGLLTIASAGVYVVDWVRHMSEEPTAGSPGSTDFGR
jgi:hypothetical protein